MHSQVTLQVYVALAAFSYLSFLLFTYTSPRRASATAIILGILFLPVFEIKIPHIPSINKSFFLGGVVTIFTFMFDRETWRQFKFKAYDIPLFLWCTSSLFSSVENDLGIKDGLYETGAKLMQWGSTLILLGRAYFRGKGIQGKKSCFFGMFAGGTIKKFPFWANFEKKI